MKKILLTICIGLLTIKNTKAQNASPVKWDYKIEKASYGNELQLHAAIDKGWHIFCNKPGGDDLAIPTTISVVFVNANNQKDTVMLTDRQANQKPTRLNIEGFGVVNYFEKDLVYKTNFDAYPAKQILIHINYQTCNDKMCLPPADVDFKIDIK
jgi:Disulphide bond corrector protein DsbC